MSHLTSDDEHTAGPVGQWHAWRAERHRALTSPTGNLALTETRWLPAGERPDAEKAGAGQPDTVTVTTLQRTDLVTGEPEHGLRFWDAESPAVRHFDRVDTFPHDPAWVVHATYTAVPGSRRVAFEHMRDNGGTRELVVPGDITLTVDGRDYTLSAFDDDGTLLLVFGDPTNGVTTYGAGRFLFVQRTQVEHRVLLDFNRAFVPPCGFSDQYNCPMPPRQNRFHLPIEAGEKLPVFRDDFPAQH